MFIALSTEVAICTLNQIELGTPLVLITPS
jgi:hypothetical protein